MKPLRIHSRRIELVEITPQLATANLEDITELSRLLEAAIPATWPPEHWEPEAIRWLLTKTTEFAHEHGWFGWYAVLREPHARTLIGTVGCKGPPDAEGVIEIGYGIVSEFQRRGFASEAAAALLDWAALDRRVKLIAAETYPHLVASLGVMRSLGMQHVGDGSEPGLVRYGITCNAWRAKTK